jgi:predicted RNA binding protein YcfA (HicA-like mRNA interferase family)
MLPGGRVGLTLAHLWSDGTRALVFDPVEFLEKLAVLIPKPRINLVVYHGRSSRRSAGTRLVRALGRAGFHEVHRKGSHVMLVHAVDPTRITVVPVHKAKMLPPGTLRAILKGARLTDEELRSLL